MRPATLCFALALAACPPAPAPEPTDASDTDPPAPTGEAIDPLSMPAEPTLSLADARSATECATCHPDHARQWSRSNHAYAMIDPVFRRLVELRQVHRDGREDRFCTQCHSAIGVRSGDLAPGFAFDDLDPITLEGVTCEACHSATEVHRTENSGHVLAPGGPVTSRAASGASPHGTNVSDLLTRPEFCGGCHDVVELNGLPLERPYEEWRSSPARDAGQGCIDCHMDRFEGPAATGAAPRTDLHDHTFAGVDLAFSQDFLDADGRADVEARIGRLLASAATVSVDAPAQVPAGVTADVVVTAQNLIGAHNLPTGSTFLRQLWLEVVATDATGRSLFHTGALDAQGDLKDWWSDSEPLGDPDLVGFHSVLSKDGTPTFLPWDADELTTNAIAPGYPRTNTFFVPIPEDAVGPVTVTTRLRFRQIAPFVLRAIGMPDAVNDLRTWDLAQETAEIALVPRAP